MLNDKDDLELIEQYVYDALDEVATCQETQPRQVREFRASSLPFCPILSFLKEDRMETYPSTHYTSTGTAIHLTIQTWLAKTKNSARHLYGNWKCTGCGATKSMCKQPKPCSCGLKYSLNSEFHRRMKPFWMYEEIDFMYRGLSGHIDMVYWPRPDFAFIGDFKCVVGSTLVNTQDGFVSMEELGFRNGSHPYTNTISGPKGARQVVRSFKSKAPTRKFVTFNGFELEGTPIHPVRVITPDLKLKWKELKDLRYGDWVVTSTRKSTPLWSKTDVVGKSLAKIMGWLTANGSWNGYLHHFSTTDIRLAKRMEKCIQKIIGQGWQAIYDKNSRTPSYVVPKELNIILEDAGYCYLDMSRGKEIPYSVRTSTKSIIDAYLNAYFECDSGYGKGGIEISSASKKFMHQLHVILWHGYGILGRRYSSVTSASNSNTPVDREYFYLDIRRTDLTAFMREFPKAKVVQTYKKELERKSNISTQGHHDRRQIPYVAQHYWKYYVSKKRGANKIQFPDGSIRKDVGVKYFNNQTKTHVSEVDLRSMEPFEFSDLRKEFYPEFQSLLNNLLNKGYTFDVITYIEDGIGTKTVYDVTIPKGHAFMSNGVVSHNTTDLVKKKRSSFWEPAKPSSPNYIPQIRTYSTVMDLMYSLPIRGWVLINMNRGQPYVKKSDAHLIPSLWNRKKSLKWDNILALASKNSKRLTKLEQAIDAEDSKDANRWLNNIVVNRPCTTDHEYDSWMKYAFFKGECELKEDCLACSNKRIKKAILNKLNSIATS